MTTASSGVLLGARVAPRRRTPRAGTRARGAHPARVFDRERRSLARIPLCRRGGRHHLRRAAPPRRLRAPPAARGRPRESRRVRRGERPPRPRRPRPSRPSSRSAARTGATSPRSRPSRSSARASTAASRACVASRSRRSTRSSARCATSTNPSRRRPDPTPTTTIAGPAYESLAEGKAALAAGDFEAAVGAFSEAKARAGEDDFASLSAKKGVAAALARAGQLRAAIAEFRNRDRPSRHAGRPVRVRDARGPPRRPRGAQGGGGVLR